MLLAAPINRLTTTQQIAQQLTIYTWMKRTSSRLCKQNIHKQKAYWKLVAMSQTEEIARRHKKECGVTKYELKEAERNKVEAEDLLPA